MLICKYRLAFKVIIIFLFVFITKSYLTSKMYASGTCAGNVSCLTKYVTGEFSYYCDSPVLSGGGQCGNQPSSLECDQRQSDLYDTCTDFPECHIGGCTWTPDPTPPPNPDPTPVPTPPSGGSCDSGCGTCGYRDASGGCGTDNSCCHRACNQNNICRTVFGNGSNQCDNENQPCSGGTQATPTPSPTPSPSGTIQARAVFYERGQTLCSIIRGSTNWLSPTNFSFNQAPLPYPSPQTQTEAAYVTWLNRLPGTYTIRAQPPPGYTNQIACWSQPGASPSQGDGTTTATLQGNRTLTWDIGYTTPGAWFQARGGSIHSNGGLSFTLPQASAQLITKEAGQARSGIASFVTGAIPNPSPGTISDNGYLIQDAKHSFPPNFSYYTYYDKRYETKTHFSVNTLSTNPGTGVYSSATSESDDLTLIGNGWIVPNNQTTIIFVPGNLTISLNPNAKITLSEGGFLAFIVKGSITVTPSTGYIQAPVNPDKITGPNLSGAFITDSTFITQSQRTPTLKDNQFIIGGTVVAKNTTLTRDLNADNSTFPGELFIYRADLWKNAPHELTDLDLDWQEVAP